MNHAFLGEWVVPLADLTANFKVVVRDRAGNYTRFDCKQVAGALEVIAPEASPARGE